MSAQQAALVGGRGFMLSTATHNGAPNDVGAGDDTAPDITLSPVARTGQKTTGFRFVFKAPSGVGNAAVAGAGGFSVTVWARDPVFGVWGSFVSVSAAYGALQVTGDVNASELYFEIGNVTTDGFIHVLVAEQ